MVLYKDANLIWLQSTTNKCGCSVFLSHSFASLKVKKKRKKFKKIHNLNAAIKYQTLCIFCRFRNFKTKVVWTSDNLVVAAASETL